MAIQRGRIPPNLHFNEPNEYIEGLKDGSLKVVTEPTTFVPGSYIGVNSFGFGGSNTHVLLKAPEADREIEPIGKLPFPKLILYSGRTKECVENVMSYVHSNTEDYYLQQLLSYQAFFSNSIGLQSYQLRAFSFSGLYSIKRHAIPWVFDSAR